MGSWGSQVPGSSFAQSLESLSCPICPLVAAPMPALLKALRRVLAAEVCLSSAGVEADAESGAPAKPARLQPAVGGSSGLRAGGPGRGLSGAPEAPQVPEKVPETAASPGPPRAAWLTGCGPPRPGLSSWPAAP